MFRVLFLDTLKHFRKIFTEAREYADIIGARTVEVKIVYHLFEAFTRYNDELMQKGCEKFLNSAIFCCILCIFPQHISKLQIFLM